MTIHIEKILRAALVEEQINLWSDLGPAIARTIHTRHDPAPDAWSMEAENIADRIRAIAILPTVGAASWHHVPIRTLLDGTYERVLQGFVYEPVDWDEVRRLDASRKTNRWP